jgi:hypothetical protein
MNNAKAKLPKHAGIPRPTPGSAHAQASSVCFPSHRSSPRPQMVEYHRSCVSTLVQSLEGDAPVPEALEFVDGGIPNYHRTDLEISLGPGVGLLLEIGVLTNRNPTIDKGKYNGKVLLTPRGFQC